MRTNGPASLARGKEIPATLFFTNANVWRCVTKYPAKNIASAILANSPG